MGEKYRACRERRVKTAGGQYKETVTHSLKILTAEVWEFAVFYICSFPSICLTPCPHPLLPKYYRNRDSQVNRLERDRPKQCLGIQHHIDHAGSGTDASRCFCPGQLITDFITEPCLDSSLLRRFPFSHYTH